MSVALSLTTRPALRRSADRKVTNLPSPNGKTAKIANAFGLPSGRAFTCPGATATCEKVCYAGKLEKIYSGVRNVITGNLDALQAAGTVDGMAELLSTMVAEFVADCEKAEKAAAKKGAPLAVPRDFRIHWDGDFYSLAYAEAWAATMRAYPGVRFWVYTRSFHTDGGGVDVLPALSGIPNLSLYLSVDPDNIGQAVKARRAHPWAQWAFLADTFADGKAALSDTGRRTYPCPENGGRIPLIDVKGSACIKCGICPSGRGDVVFSIRKK